MEYNSNDPQKSAGQNLSISLLDSPGWIDISVPLRSGMVHWPSDPSFQRDIVQSIQQGATANLSKITMGTHSGTHIDAPLHFIQEGKDISSLPLEDMIGIARVIEISDPHLITVNELLDHKIRAGERILFKTLNSSTVWKTDDFIEHFVSVSREAAEFLAKLAVKAIGVDYLSVGGYHSDGSDIHRILLGAGIWLIEGLDLSAVDPGDYFIICLPLRICNGDGSPARAALRPL